MTLGMTMSLPINRGRISASRTEARARLEASEARREVVGDSIELQVATAAARLHEQVHEVRIARERMLPLAERAFKASRASYDANRADLLTVLNSLRGSVEVVVSMAGMGAMPYMESRAKVRPVGAGMFRATYGLPMGGEWDVAVRLHPEQGAPAEAHYRLSTSIRGLAFGGGTPAAGSPASGSAGAALPALGDSSTGAVLIDPTRRQSLGIRTEAVQVRELSAALRVPGRVAYDEAHQADVALKFSGSVRRLLANVTGQPVRRGQTLLAVYSPDLWAAQQEYIEAARAARSDEGKSSLAGSSAEIARAARERLALWDISSTDIDQIAQTGHPIEAVPIRSPVSGVVVEKGIVEGSPFQAGQVLFRIAALDPIWVIASVPQQDASFVRRGMAATIQEPYPCA